MISAIITLYFLGLSILLLSDFVGLGLFRFRKNNMFLGLFLGYLTIVATYALFKANFNSIGIFVLLWIFGYFYWIKNSKDAVLLKKKEYLQRLLMISSLWTMIFALKASFFWNFEYNAPNLLFIDNEFYMKVAEGYHLTGHENALGLKNTLFPFLNFAQPYRTNDFWLVSLGLDLTTIDTIYIWELFYSTIIIFICSLSLFVLLKRKFNIVGALVLSVVLLFAFSGHWFRYFSEVLYPNQAGGFDPIGILAYTKLAVVFSVYFQVLIQFEQGKKVEAIYFLLLIPLLVQSTIALFLIAFLMIVFCLFQERKELRKGITAYLPLFVFFIILSVGFMFFYYFNQQKEQLFIGETNLNITNTTGSVDFILQFFKKSALLFIAYYWLSFLLVTILLASTSSLKKDFRLHLLVLLFVIYLSSILVYVKFNNVGDAYQFCTNVFGPFVLSLLIYLFLSTPITTLKGKIKLSVVLLISILGANEMIGGSNFFHSTSRISYYDKAFIAAAKNSLSQLDYPYGLIYYGADLQDKAKGDYLMLDSPFFKLFGRNHTVFNIEADSLKMELTDQSNQKRNVFIRGNALNIWLHNANRWSNTKRKLNRKDFYEAYPFSFCISKIAKDSLPDFIQSDIVNTVKDANSKVYFYTLDRNLKDLK